MSGNQDLAHEVMKCFFEENPEVPKIISACGDNLDALYSPEGIEEAVFQSHRLASGASHVGADRLTAAARRMEMCLLRGEFEEVSSIAGLVSQEFEIFSRAAAVWIEATGTRI